MSNPVRVTVTGAAGQIGYSIVFRIASGQMLGPSQPIDLRLLEIPQAMGALEGVAMELVDCAFPCSRASIFTTIPTRPSTARTWRCSSARVRGPRAWSAPSCSARTARSSPSRAKALNERADDDVKVLVVGNPANTNCLIAMNNAPDIPRERFTSMMRLDHNRAVAQLANKLASPVTEITYMGVWGNHSPTMYPDLFHAQVSGRRAVDVVDDMEWIEQEFLPGVGKRGAAIIEARGASSAASAASAAIDHVQRLGHRHGRRLGLDGRRLRRLLRDPRGPDLRLPLHLHGRRVDDRARGSSSTTSHARRSTPPWPSSSSERDTVAGQGMI